MKKAIKDFLLKLAGAVVCACLILLFLLVSIDREMAMRDYNNGKYAEGCLFQFNCDHFNSLD